MKRIAVEEHIWIEDLKSYLETRRDYPNTAVIESANKKAENNVTLPYSASSTPPEMMTKLIDVEDIRLKDMDKYGIDMQVLSSTLNLAPYGSDSTAAARRFNDAIAKVTKKYPKRFAAFATISPYDPAAAAMELERGVKELGFKGTMVPSSISSGEYWDNQKYWGIFEKAEELGVPRGYLWNRLQKGHSVTLEDGVVIDPVKSGILGKSRKGRILIVSGDTKPTDAMRNYLKEHQVSVLIHEATFLDELRDLAEEKKHTTVKEAALLAKEGNVEKLILTHFSARYLDDLDKIENEARNFFEGTIIATDGFIFTL